MTAVFARIIARYASGALVTYGVVSPETADAIFLDPDVIIAIGLVIAGVSEWAYAQAVKHGWMR